MYKISQTQNMIYYIYAIIEKPPVILNCVTSILDSKEMFRM